MPPMPSVRFKTSARPTRRGRSERRLELFTVGGIVMARDDVRSRLALVDDVKPIAERTSCQAHHVGIVLGEVGVRMDDGRNTRSLEAAYDIPPGHDGWVIGDEPWVTIDFIGMATFGEPSEDERVLMSILFTDIVDSTTVARIGDLRGASSLRVQPRITHDLERFRSRRSRYG